MKTKGAIFVQRRDYGRALDVYIAHLDAQGHVDGEVQSLVFEPVEPSMAGQSCISLEEPAAQHLMDQLWANGLRPSGEDTIGAAKAKDAHIIAQAKELDRAWGVIGDFVAHATKKMKP